MTGALRTITAEERRLRLGGRHRLAKGHHADKAASSLVCLHGTDPAPRLHVGTSAGPGDD